MTFCAESGKRLSDFVFRSTYCTIHRAPCHPRFLHFVVSSSSWTRPVPSRRLARVACGSYSTVQDCCTGSIFIRQRYPWMSKSLLRLGSLPNTSKTYIVVLLLRDSDPHPRLRLPLHPVCVVLLCFVVVWPRDDVVGLFPPTVVFSNLSPCPVGGGCADGSRDQTPDSRAGAGREEGETAE